MWPLWTFSLKSEVFLQINLANRAESFSVAFVNHLDLFHDRLVVRRGLVPRQWRFGHREGVSSSWAWSASAAPRDPVPTQVEGLAKSVRNMHTKLVTTMKIVNIFFSVGLGNVWAEKRHKIKHLKTMASQMRLDAVEYLFSLLRKAQFMVSLQVLDWTALQKKKP